MHPSSFALSALWFCTRLIVITEHTMLLTSAADSTVVMHNKFANFADYNVPPNLSSIVGQSPNIVSRNLEVNLGEVSSTTDILPSPPPVKSERDGYVNVCQHIPHGDGPVSIKRDPEQQQIPYSATSLHSPAFFNPQSLSQSMQPFYQNPVTGSCATQYQPPPTPAQFNRSGFPAAMYPVQQFSTAAADTLSSLISQQDHHNYQTQQQRDMTMSADLAAAGAVAAAAARARAVGGGVQEEQVMSQQRASRRQMHKICEQKRRDGLKTAMETLKMTIPGCSILSDQSQQNILLKAYQFVCDLVRKQQSNNAVIEELRNVKEKNDVMQAEIEFFKEEYKKLSSVSMNVSSNMTIMEPDSTGSIP